MAHLTDDHRFTFQGRKYFYTSGSHYKCEFCDRRSNWNAVIREDQRYTFVCDDHFLQHCEPKKAARFRDPRPDETYKLTTIAEFLEGVEALKEIYSAQGRASMGD